MMIKFNMEGVLTLLNIILYFVGSANADESSHSKPAAETPTLSLRIERVLLEDLKPGTALYNAFNSLSPGLAKQLADPNRQEVAVFEDEIGNVTLDENGNPMVSLNDIVFGPPGSDSTNAGKIKARRRKDFEKVLTNRVEKIWSCIKDYTDAEETMKNRPVLSSYRKVDAIDQDGAYQCILRNLKFAQNTLGVPANVISELREVLMVG